MKFSIIICVVQIQYLSIFGAYVSNIDSGNINTEPLHNIYSNHIPQFLEPLNLTTGELKLFAGHSLQLIKAKCPAVSQERLSLITKYITKLISRTNPVPGSSNTFNNLITSISRCTKHQITDEEKAKRQQSFFQFLFHPLRSFRTFFGSSDAKIKDAVEGGKDSNSVTPNPDPDTMSLDDESAPVQVIKLHNMEDKTGFLGIDDDNDEFTVPSSSASPFVEAVTDAPDTPLVHIFYSTTSNDNNNDDSFASWDPLGWVGGIFRAIRKLFSGMFGAENSTKGKEVDLDISQGPSQRAKRAADDAPPQPTDKPEAGITEKAIIALKGREAFMALIDNMCRIYCNECVDQDQVRNYKAAAKELFQLILTDSTGIQLASKHFLEPDFLQSLNDC